MFNERICFEFTTFLNALNLLPPPLFYEFLQVTWLDCDYRLTANKRQVQIFFFRLHILSL